MSWDQTPGGLAKRWVSKLGSVTRRPNEISIENSLKEGQNSKFGPSFRDFADNSPVKRVYSYV